VSDHAGPFEAMKLVKPVDEIFGKSYIDKFVKPGVEEAICAVASFSCMAASIFGK